MPKKLKNLHQTHGMVEKFKPTTIDQVLGGRGTSSYKFLADPFSEEEYSGYIKNLGNSELRAHCEDFGLIFVDNRNQIERKLLGLFRENRAKYRAPLNATPEVKNNPNYANVAKIMAAGK